MNVEEEIRVGNAFRNMTGIKLTISSVGKDEVTVTSPYGTPCTLNRSTVEHAVKSRRWS